MKAVDFKRFSATISLIKSRSPLQGPLPLCGPAEGSDYETTHSSVTQETMDCNTNSRIGCGFREAFVCERLGRKTILPRVPSFLSAGPRYSPCPPRRPIPPESAPPRASASNCSLFRKVIELGRAVSQPPIDPASSSSPQVRFAGSLSQQYVDQQT